MTTNPERLLLHVCCGPCAIVPVQTLHDQGREVVGLYYNPNIHGVAEYLRRREALQTAAAKLEFSVIYLDGEYDPRCFFQAIAHQEATRCPLCYRLRLERVFAFAAVHGFAAVSTTLLYSTYQNQDAILAIGKELQDKTGIRFHGQDFRPGWQQGITVSKQWGLYRQNYCGCLYSELDRRTKLLRRLADEGSPLPGPQRAAHHP